MATPTKIFLEEFEQGTWIADLEDIETSDGSFDLAGETWQGSVFSQKEVNERFSARIVGGSGGLGTQVRDLYYDGGTQLKEIVSAIARRSGETPGSVDPRTIETYMRIRGTAGSALDQLSETLGLRWWVSRNGAIDVLPARPEGPEASGVLEAVYPDGSVLLAQPESVQVGGTYNGETIRHVRWFQTSNRFEAQLFFAPFGVRREGLQDYDRMYSANVDAQNNDGSLNVIVAGRFELTNVPFLSGIPTAKLVIEPGDLVAVGFYSGDPRKPFALATPQVSDGKATARVDDTTECGTLTAVDGMSSPVAFTYTPPGGAPGTPATSIDIVGVITSGNERILL